MTQKTERECKMWSPFTERGKYDQERDKGYNNVNDRKNYKDQFKLLFFHKKKTRLVKLTFYLSRTSFI